MYASTEKKIPWKLFASIMAIGVLIIGGLIWYFYQNTQSSNSLAVSLEAEPPAAPPPSSKVLSLEKTDELGNVTAALESLQKEHNELLVSVEDLETFQNRLEVLRLGKEVFNDFTVRFFQYENLLGSKSFYSFFTSLVSDYIANRRISVKPMKTKAPAFKMMHQEFVEWVLSQEDEKLEALATLVGFYVIERLYQLPLSSVASSLSAEISSIDFNKTLFMADVEVPPVRDANGELKMDTTVHLDDYTSAQQFFYRRGPLFSNKVMVFLNAYLAYEGL